MTTTRRLLLMPARFGAHASAATRRQTLSLALIAATGLVLLIAAAPAGAIVTKVGSATVGLQPRNVAKTETEGQTPETFDNFNGNPVMHSNSTYVIYWDPTDHYHGDWQHLIDTFLHDVGSDSGRLSNVFAVDAQYTDRSNQPASYHSTFKGAFTDTTKYPHPGCKAPNPLKLEDQIVTEGKPSCLTKEQVQEELVKFIAQHSLPKGMGTVYYLLTPPGVSDCIDAGEAAEHCSNYSGSVGGESYEKSFCSYHGDINPGGLESGDGNTVLYAAIPWTAGGLGDFHLVNSADRAPAFDCQDGGFDASSKNPPEKKESKKVKSANETKAFEEKNAEEKLAQLEAEALEEPHQQEPNQVPCPSPDGFCDTGLADLVINQIAVEQQNVVTDPLLNAWQDSVHNEATDECRNYFAPATEGNVTANPETGAGTLSNQSIDSDKYYLNAAFNRAASRLPYPGIRCMTGVELEPLFTAPNQVNSGELVSFDGMESNITLNSTIAFPPVGERQTTYATYTWNFGDGTPTVSGYAPGAPTLDSPETTPCEAPWLAPCAASTFHAYQYGGTYEVTLTVKDVGGNVASVSKEITVAGPPPPSPAPSNPSSPGTTTGGTPGGTTTSGVGTSTNPATTGAHAKPIATQAVVSQTLASALRSGVAVRYSVNEQVAGRFEVLIASSTARKLGLKGARATGLAAGVAAQTVIGKAVLVTTKGGRSTYKILLSKATASRLRRARTVSLMVRLAVHNSAGGTAIVISSGKLSH